MWLSFTLELRNNGELPIEYHMKRLYLTVDDIRSEIPMNSDMSYRIAREKSNFFLFTVGLSPLRSGPIKGMLEYMVRYGPVTATEYYTQAYEFFFQDALNSGGTYSRRFGARGKEAMFLRHRTVATSALTRRTPSLNLTRLAPKFMRQTECAPGLIRQPDAQLRSTADQ